MNILILGAGGREHALAWKLKQSTKLHELYVAPGNAGTAQIAKNIPIGVNDFEEIKQFVLGNKVGMVVVGPEDPLVNGIHDYFLEDQQLRSIPVIGPQKMAATLEGSKEFAKEFMMRHHIPTARYESFTAATVTEGFKFMETLSPPFVLKADGLAAGKGVVILNNLEEAKAELKAMLVDEKFGSASATVVIEEFLDGIELSVFVLTDGVNYKVLPTAKDYKRIGEGDTGLNTGGMGAVSPVPFANDAFMSKVENRIIQPTIHGLKSEGIPYKGFIFFGLINVDGDPYVIEYNVRMGDPEAEVVLPRVQTDFIELLKATAEGTLDEVSLEIDPQTVTTVMLVSGGYPGSYAKGKKITLLEHVDGSIPFHAGTKIDGKEILTNGGRVIAVSSFGKNMQEALSTSYKNADVIAFDKKQYRKDIGFDL